MAHVSSFSCSLKAKPDRAILLLLARLRSLDAVLSGQSAARAGRIERNKPSDVWFELISDK
jgi:hypothetical protein